MGDKTCRICLGELASSEEGAYHEACSRRLFGAPNAPALPYSWKDLNQLAEKVVRRHVTVPGVQPKLSLHLEKGPGRPQRLTLVGMEGGYILKPPVKAYPEMPELEHVTMRMAGVCGIETCVAGLVNLEDGRRAFIARRMDRVDGRKLHMEDMCQLTDRLTDRKYSGSLEMVGKTILKHCDDVLFDALRFFELTVFCFLTGNADMHLKNFSLLYKADGKIALAPAYDLLPTRLLLPEDRDESALTIHGKKRRLSLDDFLQLGERIRLREKQLSNALKRLSRSLPDALSLLDRCFCRERTKERYHRLIAERAERLGIDGHERSSEM